jgi:hypothetical protein
VPHQLQYPIFYSCPRSLQGHLHQPTKTFCYQNLLVFVTGLLDASSNTQLLNSGANQFRCKVRAWQRWTIICNEIGILTKNVPSRCWRRFPLGTNSVTKIRSLSASKWPISFTRFKCSTADSFSTSFSNSFEIPVAKISCYPPYDTHNSLKFVATNEHLLPAEKCTKCELKFHQFL